MTMDQMIIKRMKEPCCHCGNLLLRDQENLEILAFAGIQLTVIYLLQVMVLVSVLYHEL